MKTTYKTLEEIKAAVTAGTKVQWQNDGYTVSLNKWGDFNILCSNGHCAVLTSDYKAEDFYSVGHDHPLFFKPITDLEGAKTLLRYLHAKGLDFHCEDDASTIEDPVTGPVFAADEAEALNARMEEAWRLDWPEYIGCPCGYALALDPDYTEEIIARAEGGEDDARRLAAEIATEKDGDA